MRLIPRFLSASGQEEVLLAKKEATELEQERERKGLLKGPKEERLKKLRSITRTDLFQKVFLGMGVAIGLTVGGVAYFSAPAQKKGKEEAKQGQTEKIERKELSEEQLDALIARAEEGFTAFEKEVRALVEEAGSLPPGATADHFYAPFEVMELNKKNPLKNSKKLERLHTGNVKLENINYFSYGTPDQADPRVGSGFAALFDPARRQLLIDPNFNPDSKADMLILYHEIMHAVQDANIRATVQSQQQFEEYRQSLEVKPGGRMRLNILNEVDAYASELEVADLLLKGKLRSRTATMDDLIRALHPRPEQMDVTNMLHQISVVYFPHGISDGKYENRFVGLIHKMYADRGYEVYLRQ